VSTLPSQFFLKH